MKTKYSDINVYLLFINIKYNKMDRIISSSVVREILWTRIKPGKVKPQSTKVEALVPPEMRVVISGEGKALGDWQPSKGVDLICEKLPYWHLPAKINIEEGTQFKFVVMRGSDIVAWEEGENRVYSSCIEDYGEFGALPKFEVKFAGVSIPVFSIKSEGCEGIGDYVALGEMAKWASEVGLKVIQTLPLNDTTITHTYKDSYPYNAISVYALHPLYIRVSEMDKSADVSELNSLESADKVDYEAVDALKWKLFKKIYKKKGSRTFATKSYKEFYEANKEWLNSYAAFSLLRDKFETADYNKWDKRYRKYNKRLENKVLKEYEKEAGFYMFLQFYADSQLKEAHKKARLVGVAFKGDIPIGVSPHSVEVWKEPHLFNLNGQAGAPPDDFAVEGQNWGFPTYNWREMSMDDYKWWESRFMKMADYFDMYRIDHILGFFRIWEVQKPNTSGLMGHFAPALPFSADELSSWGLPMFEERYLGVDDTDLNTLFVRDHKDPTLYHPRINAQYIDRYFSTLDSYEKEKFNALYDHYFYQRHNDFWAAQALNRLPALLNSTSMLACAEDLGMIPDCVAGVLNSLQVATLEVQRMPKGIDEHFGNPYSYPYRSVATTSTHDMSTLRGWWKESSELTQYFYSNVMCWGGDAPVDATAEICASIVDMHLSSSSMAVILPWQDIMAINEQYRYQGDVDDERINEPSKPNHYWQYRMHMNVEELNDAWELNLQIGGIIKSSNR